MNFSTYKPGPPLDHFVNIFWLYEGYTLEHTHERLLPTGTVELVISLEEEHQRIYDRDDITRYERYRGPLVCGPHSRPFVIDTAQQTAIIGINFKPGGAARFMGVPAGELHNEHIELNLLWNSAAAEMRTANMEAPTTAAKFRVLERNLLARARGGFGQHPAVDYAVTRLRTLRGTAPVAEVLNSIGLSNRRFIELFQHEVGLTPKLFHRIMRFQDVITGLGPADRVNWIDVALGCGYYDQAHFIHDFRTFAGLSPTAYLRQRGEHQNHVPIRA